MKKIRLSILDQSPVRKGGTAQQALQETLTLAKRADELGYTRYWLSEHHNTGSLAGSAPEVLIPYLATQTKRIRLGSGGIMLPNHSALKVAENFRTLETLFPGRIDLGIGRAPGGDRITAAILNPSNNFNEKDFVQQLIDLQHYLDLPTQYDDYNERIKAIPLAETAPALWVLSSSGQSGLFAAHFGMAFSFAHFINPIGGAEAVKMYRDRFQQSAQLQEPLANVALFVMCAETEEKAMELQRVMDVQFLRIEQAISEGIPSYEDIKDLQFSEAEQQRILFNRQRMVSGTPEQVKTKLTALAEAYDVDELVIVTITHDFEDRIKSYELLAHVFEIA
jgi:luciferase family oxidoreductase group 1